MYLDPAFGGMLIQLAIALAAAGGAIIFMLRRKISALFSKNKADDAASLSRKSSGDTEDGIVDMLSEDNSEE